VSSQGIFLSYRRADAAPYARLLQFQLRERFPDARVFMDLDSIEAGLDFTKAIREAIESSAVLVALIGRQWATLVDEEGRRRLDNPDDYVRFEVQTALERGVRVIPVLVDGAKALQQRELPLKLHRLARLNALELSYSRYDYDANRLFDLIRRLLTAASGTGARSQYDGRADGDAPIATGSHGSQSARTTHRKAAQEVPEVIQIDRARATRVLNSAALTAQFVTDDFEKAIALAHVARALAAIDRDRAARARR
jgi:hypothetical protein